MSEKGMLQTTGQERRLGAYPEARELGGGAPTLRGPKQSCARSPSSAARAVSAILILLLLLPPTSAEILLDKQTASVGEPVRIAILPALDSQTLIILAPNATYRFIGGIAEETVFIPQQQGTHTIRLLDASTLIESVTFDVAGAETPPTETTPQRLPLVASTEVSTGSPIIINAPLLNVREVRVIHDGEPFISTDSRRPITYIPERPGAYDVTVEYANGTQESASVTVSGAVAPYQGTASQYPTTRVAKPFSLPPAEGRMRIETAEGRLVNADLIWRRDGTIIKQTAAAVFDPRALDQGRYDLEMQLPGRSISAIRFRGLSYSPDAPLGIEELEPELTRGAPASAIDAFAIDPSMLDFESATVTFTATGYALYKCAQYNFTTRTCTGENVKLLETVPGQEYTIELSSADPLFSQTGYLANQNFDSSTTGWTTLNEGAVAPTYSWIASDTPQSGVAQISHTTRNRITIGNYYQSFNLTIPAGTTLVGVNFSALWRIPTYTTASPGWINLSIQDAARTTTYCRATSAFSSTTAWASAATSAGADCPLGNFTPNTNYTFRISCYLALPNTQGAAVACRWDNASITVWYNDTTAPVMRTFQETPDPVNFGENINITVNITDNIGLHTTLVEILGVNYTLADGPGDIFYFDGFDTARAPGTYSYKLYANDTNNNRLLNASSALNFTIRDVIAPIVTLLDPQPDHYTPNTSFTAFYTLADQVGVNNCSLNLSGTVRNSTLANPLGTTLNLTAPLPAEGTFSYNITCNDTSNNWNTSETRKITRDTIPPSVLLNTTDASVTNASSVTFSFTPYDATLKNCSLWGNWTGSWAQNATLASPANTSLNAFPAVTLSNGAYRWNVLCSDLAGNSAFNTTNFTITVDTIAPKHSAQAITPASGAVYAPGAAYEFNITWTDEGAGVSSVRLETNFSGTLANVTPTKAGSTYTYTFTDRPAGSYQYRWHANDTAGNTNRTAQATYVIARAQPSINLTINDSESNISVELGDFINMTGKLLTPASGILELYLDQQLIKTGDAYVSNVSQLTQEKRYNVTLIYPQTQNYTEGRRTLFADITDKTPPSIVLGNPANDSFLPSAITFFFTPYDNVEIANCTVLLDGMLNETKDVSRSAEQNITVIGIVEGLHSWSVNCSDSSNNSAVNASLRYFTVDVTPPAPFGLSSPGSGSVTSNPQATLSWQQSSDLNFKNYTVLVDNDVNFGSINYAASTAPVTNTSRGFTLLDQTVWYWKVVAYDKASNQRTSSQVFNLTIDATPPVVTQSAPANNTHTRQGAANLTYGVDDFTQILNCSLYINGAFSMTNGSPITKGVASNFSVTLVEGRHNWSVACTDEAQNAQMSPNQTITVDLTPPGVFVLTGPPNDTLTSNATPTYTWLPTTEENFKNYTVQVSEVESFSYVNYTFSTYAIADTSAVQAPALADGTWYWRVIAYDLAGNERIMHPTIKVDTKPPTAFDLVSPANDTQAPNDAVLFSWQQSSDANFKNYTLLISSTPTFSSILQTNSTLLATATSAWLRVARDVVLYWRVVAYDEVNFSTNSTNTYSYIADYAPPHVTQVSPAGGATIISSALVSFQYNITDVGGIDNCSLYINGALDKTTYGPQKNTTLTLTSSLENGEYTWYVNCTDKAGNTNTSLTRSLTVNVTIPQQRLYESSPGTTNYAATQVINLTYNPDATENSVSFSVAGPGLATAVDAAMRLNGSGMIISNNTAVNFSGVFSQSNNNVFFVTWKLYKANSSGLTLICQAGDDSTGGVAIGSTTKKTLTASCTNTLGDVRLYSGDNVTLRVSVYNSGGSARTFTHFWEGASASYAQFTGYKLGTLQATLSPVDPRPSEGVAFVEQCNATCLDGTCLSTDIYLQQHNGTAWVNLSTTGNVTLNGTQVNPASLGNINSTISVNFSLFGSLHSHNNSVRCLATSTYSESTSEAKNISVIDRLPPLVFLDDPQNNIAVEPQYFTFRYTASDLRLKNCSLWGNFSGTWAVNQTHEAPTSGVQGSFAPVYLDYGLYRWNVQCYDYADNGAFNATDYRINVAGDLEIAEANITFSTMTPIEGQSVTITANITNRANRAEASVGVAFYNGDPAAGGILLETKTVSLPARGYAATNTTWTATLGAHNFYVVVDPPAGSGLIIESDESNNVANHTLLVAMWQVYYGNVTGLFTLGESTNQTFANWTLRHTTGNIFITDSDTKNGIAFQFLHPLGRSTGGTTYEQTLDDFTDADSLLAAAAYDDDVNATFTESGTPRSTETFEVFGRSIPNVPIVNSSTDGNFTTGILWDSDDSINSHYDMADAEDLIFITSIKDATLSANGVVDYEIRVPSRLKEYRGTTSTVSLYYELQ